MKTKFKIIILGIVMTTMIFGVYQSVMYQCGTLPVFMETPYAPSLWKCLEIWEHQSEQPAIFPSNFSLTVSNQSFDIDPVDILVKIDGKIVIDDEFLVIQQHNYQHYDFILEPGVHTLYAESIKGKYQLKEEFTLVSELWASIAFQYSEGDETLPQLRLKISETKIGFL